MVNRRSPSLFSFLILCLFSCSNPTLPADTVFHSLDGEYVGLEEMCYTDSSGIKECYSDPVNPDRTWYHLGTLSIRGDSAFLDQSPITIGPKGDTGYSVSDGGFYYYRGVLNRDDNIVHIRLVQTSCDYCPVPIVTKAESTPAPEIKVLTGQVVAGTVTINGYRYRKVMAGATVPDY